MFYTTKSFAASIPNTTFCIGLGKNVVSRPIPHRVFDATTSTFLSPNPVVVSVWYRIFIHFIINYINNYSVETEKYDTALTGFLCILRIFILNDNNLLDYISKNNNLYDILIDKCIFSKCKSI